MPWNDNANQGPPNQGPWGAPPPDDDRREPPRRPQGEGGGNGGGPNRGGASGGEGKLTHYPGAALLRLGGSFA